MRVSFPRSPTPPAIEARDKRARSCRAWRVADVTEVTVNAKFRTIYRLTYVNVSLVLRAAYTQDRVRFYAGAGPEFGVMFTSRLEDHFEAGIGGFEVYEEPPTENSTVRNHVLAVVAGVFF